MKLGGVIYLHDISQTRMLGTTRKNFDVFLKLCGEEAEASIILGTTKWTNVLPEIGAQHEKQLVEKYWNEIISRGSRVFRFQNSEASAWEMVGAILDKFEERLALRIQNELVDHQRWIPETDAGKALRYTLEQLLAMQRKMAAELQAQRDQSEVEERLKDNHEEIRKTLRRIKDLQVTLPRRILIFFGLSVSPVPKFIIIVMT